MCCMSRAMLRMAGRRGQGRSDRDETAGRMRMREASPEAGLTPPCPAYGRMAWNTVRAISLAPAAFGWIWSGNISG